MINRDNHAIGKSCQIYFVSCAVIKGLRESVVRLRVLTNIAKLEITTAEVASLSKFSSVGQSSGRI